MIAYLRRELERCLMDRAFRTLHEKIDDQGKQIKQLHAQRDRVQAHIGDIEKSCAEKIDNAITDRNAAKSELDRQIGINRVIKTKRHIEGQRQKAVINQLRDFMTPEQFVKICESVNALPDSDFIAEDFRP